MGLIGIGYLRLLTKWTRELPYFLHRAFTPKSPKGDFYLVLKKATLSLS